MDIEHLIRVASTLVEMQKTKELEELMANVLIKKRGEVGSHLLQEAQFVIVKDGVDVDAYAKKPYLTTTQNQQYLNTTLPKDVRSAFIILGSGDTLFELASRGIKDITAAEKNELQILVAKLRIASLKTLSAKDYEAFIVDHGNRRFLSKDIFRTVSEALKDDEETLAVWTDILNLNPREDVRDHFLKNVTEGGGNLSTLKYGIPYLKRKPSFYEARKTLEEANIKIVLGEAIDYLLRHPSENFDYIDITNILLFYYQFECGNNEATFLKSISKLRTIYEKSLKSGGTFTFDYQFGANAKNYDGSIRSKIGAGNFISVRAIEIYRNIYNALIEHFDLQVGTVESVIKGVDKARDTYLYTTKR